MKLLRWYWLIPCFVVGIALITIGSMTNRTDEIRMYYKSMPMGGIVMAPTPAPSSSFSISSIGQIVSILSGLGGMVKLYVDIRGRKKKPRRKK